MVTTEKDAVNLPEMHEALPIYFPRIAMQIEHEELVASVEAGSVCWWGSRRTARRQRDDKTGSRPGFGPQVAAELSNCLP